MDDTLKISTEAEALEAFKNGATLPKLARALTMHPPTLRNHMIRLAGGSANWIAIMAARGGPKFGPGLAAFDRTPPDDSAVPTVRAMPVKAGWTLTHDAKLRLEVFKSPAGVEYIRADAWRSADLIAIPKADGLAPVRLRVLEREVAEKKAARNAGKVTARINAAIARRRSARKTGWGRKAGRTA